MAVAPCTARVMWLLSWNLYLQRVWWVVNFYTARWLEHGMELDFQLRGFVATFQDWKGNFIHSRPRMFINYFERKLHWQTTILGEWVFLRTTSNATPMPTNNPVYRDETNAMQAWCWNAVGGSLKIQSFWRWADQLFLVWQLGFNNFQNMESREVWSGVLRGVVRSGGPHPSNLNKIMHTARQCRKCLTFDIYSFAWGRALDSLKKLLPSLHLFMCHCFCSSMKRCFENMARLSTVLGFLAWQFAFCVPVRFLVW